MSVKLLCGIAGCSAGRKLLQAETSCSKFQESQEMCTTQKRDAKKVTRIEIVQQLYTYIIILYNINLIYSSAVRFRSPSALL